MTKFDSQGLHIIRIKYWNASRSGPPPFLISALWNRGILLNEQATQNKHFCPECIKSAIPVCWCKLAYSWQSKLQSPSIQDKLLTLHKSYNDLYPARFQQDSNYWLDETGPCIWPGNRNLYVKIEFRGQPNLKFCSNLMYSKALRCTFFGGRKNLCSSKLVQL